MSDIKTSPAPIALFVYNRPYHVKKTIESLYTVDLIKESELYIFSDGPKSDASRQDLKNINEVRDYINSLNIAKVKKTYESEKNIGLAHSIINGINTVFKKHNKIIVIEDDILFQKGFLTFLNEALEIYKNDDKVMHIGAYMHKIKGNLPDTAFIKLMNCSGGWATWKRAWKHFNPDAEYLMNQFDLQKRWDFDYGRSFNFYRMLKRNVKGKNDSWAIRWYASIFLTEGLCYNPTKSLSINIGHDGSGTHEYESDSHKVNLVSQVNAERIKIQENKKVRRALIQFFWKYKIRESPKYLRYLILKKINKLKSI